MPSEPRILEPRLEFPKEALGRERSDGKVDNLLKASVRNDDLVLELLYPLADPPDIGRPSDVLRLMVNGVFVGDAIELKSYKPGDKISITLYARDRPVDAGVESVTTSINYRVRYYSGGGYFEDGPLDQIFITDILRPGKDSLGPLVFPADVAAGGITPDTLVDDGTGNLYLPCTVKGYDSAAAGDWIVGWIDEIESTAPEVEVTDAQVGTDIELRFARALLEHFDGGPHRFTCLIEDRAGNRSVVSTGVDLAIRLSNLIVDLKPAIVPGAADGLVTDSDARVDGGVVVEIPGHMSIAEGDLIVLIWNAHESNPVRVEATDVGKDPLKVLTQPYGEVYDDWNGVAGDSDRDVPATVSYRIERGGTSIGSPSQATMAPVNLFGSGGKQPKPETPEHENLSPAMVQAAGDSPRPPPNVVPADAVSKDAIATIPGMTATAPPIVALLAGDRVQLYWNALPVDTEFVVTTSGADVTRTIPAAVLAAHSPGLWNVHYTVARPLATTPFVNTAMSPAQVVDVKDTTDLPGEGKPLAPAKWVEGPATPGYPDQIDYDKALSGGGTPLRVYGYINMAQSDTVSIAFHGFDSITPPGGELVPGAEHALDYVVQPGDLIPKRDETVSPPVDTVYIDFLIPTENLLAIVYGRATFDYVVANAAGKTPAEQAWIYVSTRPPGT